MNERLSKALPFIIGLFVPLLLILTNTLWNYAGILLTMAAIVWIGFALVLLTPSVPTEG
ncbi:MAG TPA: hypothetical protein VJ400_03570 [Thermoplasmata archaeon]|nr:hypothetical protein [Thermoplasmata archaeon]